MFEQSQLELPSRDKRKPGSMLAGFALQAAILACALLFSLIFTEAVPRLRFDASLMAPPRGRSRVIEIAQPTQQPRPIPVNLKPRQSGLFAPVEIPRETIVLDTPPVIEDFFTDSDTIRGFLPDGIGGGTDINRFLFPDDDLGIL